MYFYFGVLFTVLTYIYTPFYCSFASKRKTPLVGVFLFDYYGEYGGFEYER